jgi:hypothetical protein
MGNAAYEGEAALANPANDAQDVADALASIGWNVTKVIDADRKEMNRAIDGFHEILSESPNSTALLFYAGHGIQIDGQNYLIPVRETFATTNDVIHDAISLQSILDSFDDARVSTDIVILDACRDNPFTQRSSRSLGAQRGLSIVSKASTVEGSAILFSTAPGKTAADGTGRNGVFTQALLRYVKSDLPLQMLTSRLVGDVKLLTGGRQVPYISLSLSDDFYLVPASLRTSSNQAPPTSLPMVSPSEPKVDRDPQGQKVNLLLQKQAVAQQKQELLSRHGWVTWMGTGGWVSSILGAGIVGYGWFTSTSALDAYKAASNQSGYDSARSQMNWANTCLSLGLGVGGIGVTVGIVSLFLSPDASKLENQIQEIDRKLGLLEKS